MWLVLVDWILECDVFVCWIGVLFFVVDECVVVVVGVFGVVVYLGVLIRVVDVGEGVVMVVVVGVDCVDVEIE